ncbi:MAG: ABC transporter ATP-binding protein [Anaerolineae bacterium]
MTETRSSVAVQPARAEKDRRPQAPTLTRPDEVEDRYAEYDPDIARRLAAYIRPYSKGLGLALILVLSGSALSLAGPFVVSLAIDEGIVPGDMRALILTVAGFTALNLAIWRIRIRQADILTRTGQGIMYDIRTQLFAHLQRLSMHFFDTHEVGRIISRMTSDVHVLEDFATWAIVQVVNDTFVLLGIVAVMLFMDVRLSLLTFTVLPLMAIGTFVWRARARDSYREVRRAISRINGSLAENINGVRVVQSLVREALNFTLFDGINRHNLNVNLYAARLSAIYFPSVEFANAVATAMVVWYGGRQVLNGSITEGALVAFILYVGRFFQPVRDLAMRYNSLLATMASGERIFQLLDTSPDVTDKPDAKPLPPIEGHVTFDDVSFSYTPDKPVIEHVSLDVKPGQTVAFVGSTGAGKTSLIKILARFYDVTGGAILIDGHDIRDVTQESLHRQIAIVLQENFLFSGSVLDNIRYGRLEATEEEVIEAAKAVGAHEFITSLPYGYHTEVQEGGAILSTGQRQLIAFARALLAEPRILVLDEATANIDTQTERLIQQALKRLLQGRTSFVIAHRLSTIVQSDLIVVIEHGRVQEMGTHEELLSKRGRYYELYTLLYQRQQQALAAGD